MSNGVPGVVHGMASRFLQDEDGQILEATSISAGLDYPGVGPEHAFLEATRRAEYPSADDEEVLAGFRAAGRDRGDHPRSRAGARPRLGVKGGRQVDPEGLDGALDPVGARRQGRRTRAGAHRVSAAGARRPGRAGDSSQGSARRGPQVACPVCDGGPRARLARGRPGGRRRGSRRHRDRDPVLRPGHGRPGHPAGLGRGARQRGDAPGDHCRLGWRRCRCAARGHDLLQHRGEGGAPSHGEHARRGRGERRHSARPASRGARRLGRRGGSRGRRDDPVGGADVADGSR